jgi:uncharacterized protein (TIGR03435 family)
MTRILLFAAVVTLSSAAMAQTPAGAQFDVVSIKPNTDGPASSGFRNLPDGSMIMVNSPISSLVGSASPVPVREVEGLPSWANTERYDITTKPPAGSTQEQRSEMMRNMFADRLKLAGHIEQREHTVYALVVARSDGRLGPDLKKSTLDCTPPSSPDPPPRGPLSPADFQNRCGMMMGRGTIVSGGIQLDRLVLSLRGFAGGTVFNRTGLDGFYALTLRFALPGSAATQASPDDPPEFFTAIQEQLGLKLQPEKAMEPVFVIDHIERPTPN